MQAVQPAPAKLAARRSDIVLADIQVCHRLIDLQATYEIKSALTTDLAVGKGKAFQLAVIVLEPLRKLHARVRSHHILAQIKVGECVLSIELGCHFAEEPKREMCQAIGRQVEAGESLVRC